MSWFSDIANSITETASDAWDAVTDAVQSVVTVKQVMLWVFVIAFAGLVYYITLTRIRDRGAEMAFQSYLECIRKVSTYDWSTVPGGKPGTAGEICNNVAARRN